MLRSELAEELTVAGVVVDVDAAVVGFLLFQLRAHVAVVAILVEQDAPPLTRRGWRRSPVIVGVELREASGIQAGSHGIVVERCKNHGEAGLSENLHRAANAVVDVQKNAIGGEAGSGSQQL